MNGLEHLVDALGNGISSLPGSSGLSVLLLVLALVLMWSGGAKLRRPWLTGLALVDFRLVGRPRAAFGASVAVAEFALGTLLAAAALIVPDLQIPLAATAVALFVFFSGLIAGALRRGASFSCFCFGSSDDGVSRASLARAAALAATAAAALGASAVETASPSAAERLPVAVTAIAILGGGALIRAARHVAYIPEPIERRVEVRGTS
jgi:Methylamine utilisation protein MauE